MTNQELAQLFETPTIKNSMLNHYGPQGCLLVLLYKLDVVSMRRISHSMASTMVGASKYVPPPCSIQLAVVSMNLEYLQFCPKSKAGEEFK